jgi:thiamine biosynthesis lipoprotein
VEIADPAHEGGVIATTQLRDAALATSGNTVRAHVLNPATGRPADALRQASVVTADATSADALSTAMLVSGRRPATVLRAYAV